MRIAGKATKGKGKRWKKGDSGSSNPSTKKFRTLAKNSLSVASSSLTQSSSQLTENILAHHNAIQLKHLKLGNDDLVHDNNEEDNAQSVASFASVWSHCSNVTFNKLLLNWQSSSALHREMIAVLSAVTETIQKNGGKETETEYFATLMTALESVENDEALTAIVSLINMVLRRLSPSIIRLKFSETSKIFVEYLSRYVNSENGTLIRSLCNCIGTLLKHQETAVWHLASSQQIYETILVLTIHSKPRIRKTAHNIIAAILRFATFNSKDITPHPMAGLTCDFCIRKMENMNINENMNTVLYMIGLIKDIISVLSQSHIRKCSEILLRLMTMGNAVIVSNSFGVFHELFRSHPNESLLPAELNAQIITALYDYQPNVNDVQPLCAWSAVIKHAFVNLYSINAQLCFNHLPKLFNIMVPCYLSDSTQVHGSVSDTIKTIFSNCIEPSLNVIGNELMQKLYSNILIALKYQYFNSWGEVLDVISHFIVEDYGDIYSSSFSTLAQMRDDSNCLYITELERVFARAIEVLGPKHVINACELNIGVENDFSRSWLIPILRDHIKIAELSLFVQHFMPIAFQFQKRVQQYESVGREADAKACTVLISQIWSLLPSFCRKPTDFSVSFKKMAQTIGSIISENHELRGHILSALRNLLNKNSDDINVTNELRRYSKNFIPILLNIYTLKAKDNEKDDRLSVYETIKFYLTITDKGLINTLYDKIRERLKNSDNDPFVRTSMHDLLRLFVPYITKSQIIDLYQSVALPLISDGNKQIDQKKGHRIIEEICRRQSDHCSDFMHESLSNILQTLAESLPKCAVSAQSALMRTFKTIIDQNMDDIEQLNHCINLFPSIIVHVINSLAINSKRLKYSACSLLTSMVNASKLLKDNGHLEFIENIILLLKKQEKDTSLSSSIIMSLRILYFEFRDEIPKTLQNNIIENIFKQTECNNRQIIQASIEFSDCLIRNTSDEMLSPFLQLMVQSLTNIHHRQKKHFRFTIRETFIRLIRKFGFIIISKMVPSSYSKMLRNIRKVEIRKKNKSHVANDEDEDTVSRPKNSENINDYLRDSDDDDELEIEDDHINSKKMKRNKSKQKSQYWIEESLEDDAEVFDLMSTATMRKVLSTDPNKQINKKEFPFPITDDGKIIIDTEKDERGTKRKYDDDDDDDDVNGVNTEDNETLKSAPLYHHGGHGIHRPIEKVLPGEEYRAKKAGGDMKRTDKPDPYAYIPLNRQTLNKRKRAKFKGQFKNIVKAAKKGAERGNKSKKKLQNKKQKII